MRLSILIRKRRVVTGVFLLVTISLLVSLLTLGYAPEAELSGDVILRVFPDMSFEIEAGMDASYTLDEPLPVTRVTGSYTTTPVSDEVTDLEMNLYIKIDPMYTLVLSALDFSVELHQDGLDSEGSIDAGLPGIASVDAVYAFDTDEATGESVMSLEGNATLWHDFFVPEMVEGIVDMLPDYEEMLSELIHVESQGNLSLSELSILDYRNESTSSNLWVRAAVEGDFAKASLALAGQAYSNISYTPSVDLSSLTSQSSDFTMEFDKSDLAFTVSGSSRFEGDMNTIINEMKEQQIEEILELMEDTPPDIIEDLLIPTLLDVTRVEASFDYASTDTQVASSLNMKGLGLKPPSPSILLEAVQSMSLEMPETGFLLVIEGGIVNGKTVEITVPAETTTPQTQEPDRVTWSFYNLENLEMVTFQVKDVPGGSIFRLEYLVGGLAVAGLAAGYLLLRRK